MQTRPELLQELTRVNSDLYDLSYVFYQTESAELARINRELSAVQDKLARKRLLGDFLEYQLLMHQDREIMNRILFKEFGLELNKNNIY